jgi:hypothetical protein
MYRNYQFLGKWKATSTGKLHDSLPRYDAVADVCSSKFNVAYGYDPEGNISEPPYH